MSGYVGELDGMDLHTVQRELRQMKGALGVRALDIRNAETTRRQAEREWKQQCARVRAATSGTITAKNDAAILDPQCMELQAAYDVAEAAENYAKRMGESDRTDVSNLQSQARLIETQLRLAGVPDPRAA